MDKEKCCGTCKYHRQDDTFKEDWVCVNADSEYRADFTDYEHVCDEWEERQ